MNNRIEKILAATNIRKLIEKTETVTSDGKVICPWCHDPHSFIINDRHQMYFCFCCRRGGNAIRWMMYRHEIDFQAAVEKLEENG